MGLGDRISKLLDEKGWSQAELARRVGVSTQSIWKLVTGEAQSSRNLHKIARELGTTPEYLLGETNDPASALRPSRPSAKGDPDLVELDEVDLRFGLGGTYVDGPVVETKRKFSRSWLRQFTHAAPKDLFWTTGDGDSMEPTIRSGEVILIDRSQLSPRMGDGIWAFAWGDVGMVKRLRPLPDGTVEIHSDNQMVRPAIAADGELHVVGRVVAVVRKL